MRRAWLGFLPIVLWTSACWSFDEPPAKPKSEAAKSPAEQVIALQQEFQEASAAFAKLYRDAKTDAEREKVLEKQPATDQFAARFLEIAEKHPKDAAAIDALMWVVTFNPYGPPGEKAINLLAKSYAGNPRILDAVKRLASIGSQAAEPLFRAVIEKNESREAKGMAAYGLAQLAKETSENAEGAAAEKAAKEAEALFQEVVDHYGDVKPFNETLAEMARRDLYDVRHLGIGKEAPEIEADDLDGKSFKLSDYKGKVVVLDFWGNW